MQVGGEAGEPVFIHEELAALEAVPVAVWFRGADAVVHPSWGDVFGEFVVEDCLEGGDDLCGVSGFLCASTRRWFKMNNPCDKIDLEAIVLDNETN